MSRIMILLCAAIVLAACRPYPIPDRAARAATQGRPLVVEVYQPDGQASRLSQEQVLSNELVQSALSKVDYARYDVTTSVGERVMANLGIAETPGFAVVDKRGRPVSRLVGMTDVASLVRFLEWSQIVPLTRTEIEQRLHENPDRTTLLLAARWFRIIDDSKRALRLFDRAYQSEERVPKRVVADIVWERLD